MSTRLAYFASGAGYIGFISIFLLLIFSQSIVVYVNFFLLQWYAFQPFGYRLPKYQFMTMCSLGLQAKKDCIRSIVT